MDTWLTQIGFSAAGLPWWAAFIIILITVLATKGVDAYLKWRNANLDERKYDDGEAKTAREQLAKELKDRVEKLEKIAESQQSELSATHAAHAKCEVEQAKLQGRFDTQTERMNAMQIQIDGLLRHDQTNKENTKKLAKIVEEETGKAPTIT